MPSNRKIYLYIKISPKGLFYLGKFIERKDPYHTIYRYRGSGTYWKRHLKKNKIRTSDIQTIILHETYDEKEIKSLGLYYSKLFDVSNNDNWANLVDENGEGCCNILDKEMIERRTLKLRGRKEKKYICPHCDFKGRGNNMFRYHFDNCPTLTGKVVDEQIECPHCHITGNKANMIKWHFDNCRSLKVFEIDHNKILKDDKWKFTVKGKWSLTDRTKNRMSKSRSISIIQMNLNGDTIKEWPSAKEASLTLKIGRSNITACCKGNRQIAGPFKWRYK